MVADFQSHLQKLSWTGRIESRATMLEWPFAGDAVAQPIFGGKSGGDYMKIKFQSNIRLA